ncbi:MAG: ABC transporter ATP-binding protein [Spirochaetes bacterium]|nr:MAG: ABC transporter ATP-binding protein [Spirochaetota bacterium]
MGSVVLKELTLKLDNKRILNNLSIEFKKGKINAVVGQNGAGKSTLAQTIMGLPDYLNFEGDILLDTVSLKGKRLPERAKLGITMAWQEPARFSGIPVGDFINAGADDRSSDTVKKALTLVGLSYDKYKNRYVDKTLSGGERKRIELASISAMNPKVVLMDEPDSGVDIEAVSYIFDVIQHFKSRNITVLLITHSAEVLQRADYGYILCNGNLIGEGNTEKMLDYFNGNCINCDHVNNPFFEVLH